MIRNILSIALIITLLIYIRQKFPTALYFFRSPHGVFSYFGASLNVIRQRKWFILLPFCLEVANSLGQIIHIVSMSVQEGSKLISVIEWSSWPGTRFLVANFLEQVNIALVILNSVFYHILYSKFPYLVIPTICLLFAKPIARKIKRYLGGESHPWVELIDHAYPIALGIGILLLILQIIHPHHQILSEMNLADKVENILFGLCNLIPYSLCIGLIFFSSKSVLLHEELSLGSIWKNTLGKFGRLYLFNLCIWMIFSLSGWVYNIYYWKIYAYIIYWLTSGAILFSVVLIIPVVSFEGSIKETLKNTWQFAMANLVKIFSLMLIALLVMAVPTFLLNVLNWMINGALLIKVFIYYILQLWQIVVAVVFIIALFKFYLDWSREEQGV